MSIDHLDWLALAGILLLGSAVWLWWGLPAVLAYAGGVLLVVAGAALGRQAWARKLATPPPPPDKQ